jgi:hypothetical protein
MWRGKRSSSSSQNLHPEQWAQSITTQALSSFMCLEGTLAHEPEGDAVHTMKPGDFGSNPNKGVHIIRNPSTTERAKVIDFLVAEKGQPLVIPLFQSSSENSCAAGRCDRMTALMSAVGTSATSQDRL